MQSLKYAALPDRRHPFIRHAHISLKLQAGRWSHGGTDQHTGLRLLFARCFATHLVKLRQLFEIYFNPLFVTSSHPDTSIAAIFLRLREPKKTSRLWSDKVLRAGERRVPEL